MELIEIRDALKSLLAKVEWMIETEKKPKFKVGQYVWLSVGDIVRIGTPDDAKGKTQRQPRATEYVILFADGHVEFYTHDGAEWRGEFTPWTPAVGEKVWVNGVVPGCDFSVSGWGIVKSKGFAITPVYKWAITGTSHLREHRSGQTYGMELEQLHPAAFAPKCEKCGR